MTYLALAPTETQESGKRLNRDAYSIISLTWLAAGRILDGSQTQKDLDDRIADYLAADRTGRDRVYEKMRPMDCQSLAYGETIETGDSAPSLNSGHVEFKKMVQKETSVAAQEEFLHRYRAFTDPATEEDYRRFYGPLITPEGVRQALTKEGVPKSTSVDRQMLRYKCQTLTVSVRYRH